MIGLGTAMLKGGFLGTTTRYVAGEVAPTVKDTLDYVGIGRRQATCAKCGEANSADAKFCDHCGAPLTSAAGPAPTPTPQPPRSAPSAASR